MTFCFVSERRQFGLNRIFDKRVSLNYALTFLQEVCLSELASFRSVSASDHFVLSREQQQ
jgi:hypothetical protein